MNNELSVVDLPLSEIKPYWRNPRIYDDTLPALMKSIERYGFNVPLVVDGDNVIVAGHARFKALQSLGYTHAPCVIVGHLSPKDLKEIRLLDNKVQEYSTWDRRKLMSSLEAVVSGSDVAQAFAGSLDRVVDLSMFAAQLETVDGTVHLSDAPAPQAGPDADHVKCPFCDSPLTVGDIVEEGAGAQESP